MLQVISLPGADAESLDGLRWILYVSHDSILAHTGLSEVRFGTWSASGGLERAKIRGTARTSIIEQLGGELVKALEQFAEEVPLPRVDRFEYWLLDENGKKLLALLDSASHRDENGHWDQPVWRAGTEALRRFESSFGDSRQLEAAIAAAAGPRPRALWFERRADGSGVADDGTHLDAPAFPSLLIREDWPDAGTRDLVQAFIGWVSPWLLQLPELPDERRKALEIAAWKRPEVSARVYRLFPKVFDAEGLIAARVAARLKRQQETQGLPEPFYPFNNE